MQRMSKNSISISNILLKVLVLLLAIVFLIPLYITAINIFKETSQISASPMSFPFPPILDNIKKVLSNTNIDLKNMYFNSICITVFGSTICMIISSLAAYYIARVKTNFSRVLSVYFLFGLMVPYVIIYVPLVTMFNRIGLTGNLLSLIMVFVSGSISFSVFMYSGFIGSLPLELEEAAIIDGASQFQVYLKVVLPLIKPCTTTVAIFIGLSMWNDFLTPLLIGQIKTITVGIYTAIGPYASDWGTVFAYVMFATLPIVIGYLFAQKQFIAGLTAGALKG